MTNLERFESQLAQEYARLFAEDPEYAYSASKMTPGALAAKMTAGLANNQANFDGLGVKRTCRAFGIKHTRTAIRDFLTGGAK